MSTLPSLLASAAPRAANQTASASASAARNAASAGDASRGFAKALGAAREQAPRNEAGARADGPNAEPEASATEGKPTTEARDAGTDKRAEDGASPSGTPDAADTRPAAPRTGLPGTVASRAAADMGAATATATDDTEPTTSGSLAAAAFALDARGDSRRGGRTDAPGLRAAAAAAGRADSTAANGKGAALEGADTAAGRFGDALAAAAAGAGAAGPGVGTGAAGAGGATPRAAELLPAALAAAGPQQGTPSGLANPLPAAPAAEATLPSPPGSPAFASELAARLTTFVRDGVEQARLHLNPAEMGPVEVRIQLEGGAARVLMTADLAPTRQWLEQALPTLAASLRDAGLTLAGGGVFEQATGGQTQGNGNGNGNGGGTGQGGRGRPGDAASAGADTPPSAAPPPSRRGVVDLVA